MGELVVLPGAVLVEQGKDIPLSPESVRKESIVGRFKQAVRRIWANPESETKPEPRSFPPKAF